MLRSFKVESLFDALGNDREILFYKDLTILVGKNGSGKTTVLNLMNAILSKQFHKLLDYQFSRIELSTHEAIIEVVNRPDNVLVRRIDEQIGNLIRNLFTGAITVEAAESMAEKIRSGEQIFVDFQDESRQQELAAIIAKFSLSIPRNEPLSPAFFHRCRLFEHGEQVMYFPTYRRIETDLKQLLALDDLEPRRYDSRRQYLADAINDAIRGNRRTIVGLSNDDINMLVSSKWAEANSREKAVLNGLVQDFVISLLKTPPRNSTAMDLDEMERLLGDLLQRTGLDRRLPKAELHQAIQDVREAEEAIKRPAKDDVTALNMAFERLMSFQYMKVLVEMFQETIVEIERIHEPFVRLKAALSTFLDKPVNISERLHFGAPNQDIGYEDLSAGEKQLVAFFVYAILSASPGGVILLDEPELSLHVDWQRDFLDAVLQYAGSQQYVVSTHSPFVISHYGGSMLALGPKGDSRE